MKIIFLDFDGVINDYMTMESVNQKNIDILKKIIDETDARVVVTSSNKYSFQMGDAALEDTLCYKRYITTLLDNDIDIYGFTPYVNGDRDLEISFYLGFHPEIEYFLILDDDYIIEQYKDHEIYLDLCSGLREEHIKPAIDILSGKLGFYHDYDNLDESLEDRNIRMNKIRLRLMGK